MSAAMRPELRTILWTAAMLVLFLVFTAIYQQRVGTVGRGRSAGSTIDVDITLVTRDSTNLACAGNVDVQGAKCGYDPDGQPRQTSGPVLAPYMTTDSEMFLVPDLWSEPNLAKRLADDPPGEDAGRDRRFTAHCRMQLLGPAKGFWVRWQPRADWGYQEGGAWVGSISRCRLSN